MHIVHLSSPSFGKLNTEASGKAENLKNEDALEAVALKLSDIDKRNRIDYIVITGDVAWNASLKEYKQAEEWLTRIQKNLNINNDHFIICPGNRDVDEEAMKDYEYPDTQEKANEILRVERIKEHLSHRFQNYINFVTSTGMKPYDINGLKNYLVGIVDFDDIRFIGLNTAWFSYTDKQNRGMWLGSNLITLINKQLSEMPEKFTVTLMHQKDRLHPNEMGNGEHVFDTMKTVYSFSDLVLFSGIVSPTIKASIEREAVILGCGKPFESKEPYSQNICDYIINFNLEKKLYATQHLYINKDWRKTEEPIPEEIINAITWSDKYGEMHASNFNVEIPIDADDVSDVVIDRTYPETWIYNSYINEVDSYKILNFDMTHSFMNWLKDSIFEKSTKELSEKYVDSITKEVETNVSKRIELEELLTMIISDKNGNPLSWEQIKHSVLSESSSNLKLVIKGDEGTGKSVFLSMLYYRLREMSELQKKGVYTVYIDLHYYDTFLLERAEELLNKDLKTLEALINIGMKCFMVLDGFDSYKRIHEHLEGVISEFLERNETSVFLCLGDIELQQNSAIFSHRSVIEDVINKPDLELQTNYIRTDDDVIRDYLRRLMAIFDYNLADSSIEQLIIIIKRLCLRRVDFRTIIILLRTIVLKPNIFRRGNPASVFETYLVENGYDKTKIYEEGKAALIYLSQGTAEKYMESATGLYKNRIIRSYLVANYFVNAIAEIGADKKSSNKELDDERRIFSKFKYIFASDINHMISYYIQTLDETKLLTFFESFKYLFESVDISNELKINIAFIFGRIRVGTLKQQVVNYLIEQFDKLEKIIFENYRALKDIKDEQILMYRSIATSLVFQQEIRYKKNYIKRLLYDTRLYGLNRKFDVLYYSDCPRQLLKISDLSDSELGDIREVISVLYERINSMLSEADYRMRLSLDLEILTLFSIAEYYAEDFSPLSDRIVSLISLSRKIQKFSNENMIEPLVIHFVNMVDEILSSDKPYRHIFKELLYSKYVYRTEWQEYHVKRDESMMEHIYSAFIIGEFCLPSTSIELTRDFRLDDGKSYDEYDKGKILKMILLSHLGNSFSGPYNKKTIEDRQKEDERYRYYAMLTTVPYLYGLGSDKDYWNEYYDDYTINSKVAKDICHLENLMHAIVLKQDHEVEDINLVEYYNQIIGQLQTALVKEICMKIRNNVIQ